MTLAVGMILLVSGVPALQGLIEENRHASHVNTFVSQLQYSRSEAIKRGQNVVMCRSEDGQNCANTAGWQLGWIVFEDHNLNREFDVDEPLLHIEQGWQDGIIVTSGQRRRVVYQPTGQSPGSNGTYVFCNTEYPEFTRAIILSNTGRPRLSRYAADGNPLECG